MSEDDKKALTPIEKATAERKRKHSHRFTLALRGSLKQQKFNPIRQLIALYPQLDPRDQMKMNLAFLPYLYPSYTAAFEMTRKKKTDKQKFQINTQINLSSTSDKASVSHPTNLNSQQLPTLEEIKRLAAIPSDDPTDDE